MSYQNLMTPRGAAGGVWLVTMSVAERVPLRGSAQTGGSRAVNLVAAYRYEQLSIEWKHMLSLFCHAIYVFLFSITKISQKHILT